MHVSVVGTFAAFMEPLVAAVPEPGPLTLAGVGAASLAAYGWRRRKPAVP
jgi:MYXO-CTERM domain-containing protein